MSASAPAPAPATAAVVTPDVVDAVLGIEPGSGLDAVRRARPAARENAQATYEALFAPVDEGEISLAERYAVAAFVVGVHGSADLESPLAAVYTRGLAAVAPAWAEPVRGEIAGARHAGPYGAYREPLLAAESTEGPVWEPLHPGDLGPRLTAALAHAHLLVLRPREARPEALQSLLGAGWSTDGIVTLSQAVSFLAFQIRLVAGLAALQEATP